MSSAAGGGLDRPLALAAAEHVLRYPHKVWGFGEDVGLRSLLELGDHAGEARLGDFVHALVRAWLHARGPLAPADHVAPGVVLLDLHERHHDASALDAALELGRLLTDAPFECGVHVHRRDLSAWADTIWVDCTALDGPFLARLAALTGERSWADAAAAALLGYASALQDDASGLYHHGFDVATRRTNGVAWGRGNGWALHGLVDSLEWLPTAHAGAAEARERLARLAAALVPLQDASGLWHTVVDDPTAPLEASTAAHFASGLLKARRLGLLAASLDLAPTIDRAVAALSTLARPDGALAISSATPVGDRDTYVRQGSGVFPWGQGPLILTYLELERAAAAGAGRGSA